MDLLANLRAFSSATEHGSLSRSAAALGVATSVLSRRITALETESHARLFYRTGRGLLLTEFGARLLPRARALLADSEGLTSELRGEYASPVGTVNVAVVPAVRSMARKLYLLLRDEYPGIHLRVHGGVSGQVEDWIACGKVDIGIFNRYTSAKVRGADAILHSPMVLVGPKELPVAQGAQVTLRSLEGVPMAIAMRPNTLVTALDAAARRQRVSLNFAFESDSESIIMDGVARAGLCTVVPKHVAIRDYGSASLRRSLLVEPSIEQVTWLGVTAARPANPSSRAVEQVLRAIAQELPHDSVSP
jgi:LysR family nitrogen assimilation transcriptional regulator